MAGSASGMSPANIWRGWISSPPRRLRSTICGDLLGPAITWDRPVVHTIARTADGLPPCPVQRQVLAAVARIRPQSHFRNTFQCQHAARRSSLPMTSGAWTIVLHTQHAHSAKRGMSENCHAAARTETLLCNDPMSQFPEPSIRCWQFTKTTQCQVLAKPALETLILFS